MCGIHCIIAEGNGPLDISSSCQEKLINRGPDFINVQEATIGLSTLRLTSTVLSLRGDKLTTQPFFDEATGSILAWNGEAWHVGKAAVEGNDGAAIFGQLVAACHPSNEEAAILHILRSIEGPFAFVFFSGLAKKIYFGRDRLGRRSLLYHLDEYNGRLHLCSVAEGLDAWQEVAADVVHAVDIAPLSYDYSDGRGWATTYHPWSTEETQAHIAGIGPFNMAEAPKEPSQANDGATVATLREKLAESLRLRVQQIPLPPTEDSSQDTRLAVLFSGGLDCSILARLAHDLVPLDQGIDLLNVAFENPRVAANLGGKIGDPGNDIYEACPDRITGRKSLAELLRVSPGRSWRFVAIDVPYSDFLAHRATIVSLMRPHNTEMDLSIASALYFAARGKGLGYVGQNPIRNPYQTNARVLLSGLGADELFGGYSRHSAAFERAGYAGLASELRFDVSRIGERNLGRDDRVMAHWGREVRFPYLDENLMRWAMALPVWEKCDFGTSDDEPGGGGVEPAKRVLRLLALQLGMDGVAKERKRAIQFGARTAKMESGRTKGTTLIS